MAGFDKYSHLFQGFSADPDLFPHGTPEEFIDGVVANLGINAFSIWPLVVSLAKVKKERGGQSFRIAVSGKPELESQNGLNPGCQAVDVLAETGSMHEAVAIAADLRKYYLRHYPGRCHRNTGESNFDSFNPAKSFVYIAFFDQEFNPPRDGL